MTGRPLHTLIRQAARDFGRRDLAIAIGLSLFFLVFADAGGYLLIPLTEGNRNPIFDPNKTYAKTFLIQLLGRTLPLVFAIRTAELTIADGARPWHAYLAALLATLAFALVFNKVMWLLPIGKVNRAAKHVGRDLWMLVTLGTRAGTTVLMYALWRASQRTTEQIRAAEAARARDLQRLQSAELLAVQARVDPQLLFDALGHVGALQRRDPGAADTLLNDLIALLRAMLPRIGSIGSTVEREFSVVQTWLRVTRALLDATDRAADVSVAIDSSAQHASLAPMLALPLVRAVLEDAACRRLAWQLDAQASGGHLTLTLSAHSAAPETIAAVLARVQLDSLHERLALLYGDAARLSVSQAAPLLTLELPLAFEAGAAEASEAGVARSIA